MPRKHRRRRPRRSKTGVQLVQIIGLALILVMVIFFRDTIAGGAGKFFDSFGAPEDVQVDRQAPGTADRGDAGETDASRTGTPSD